MAFGCRDPVSSIQWLPNSEASSSTLSASAQPFTTVHSNPKLPPDTCGCPHRDRFDHFAQPNPPSAVANVYPRPATMSLDLGRRQGGGFPSGVSDWPVRRTLSSNLVQAEPFYPQYAIRDSVASKPPPVHFGFNQRSDYDRVDRNRTHCNVRFDGNSQWENGTGRRISSWMEPGGMGTDRIRRCLDPRDINSLDNSPWGGFSGKGRIPNHGAAIQHGDNDSSSLPCRSIWNGNSVDSYIIKGQDTGHLNWLDGSSIHLQASMAASTNPSNTRVSSESFSAPAPVIQINVPDASKESCGTFCASGSPYYARTTEPGFHRSEQKDYYVDTPYSYPKISSPPLRKMNPFSSSTLQIGKFNTEPLEFHQNNSLHRHRVSVTIIQPNMNSHINGEVCAQESDKCEDNGKSFSLPKSLLTEKLSGSGLKHDDPKNFPDRESELERTSLSINGSNDVNDSNHNSVTIDQSNNAVDSPCWKGASASRFSPLYDSDSATCSNTAQKFEKLELINLTANETGSLVSEGLEKHDESLILKEVEGGCQSKESCLLLSKSRANSCPLTAKSSCRNGVLNVSAATQSPLLDIASDAYQGVKGDVSSSSGFDASNLDKSAERRASEVGEISGLNYCDTHFLVRSIYDLSALLSSCCNGENTLKELDYDVLLMAKYNLEACLAKKFEPQKENFVCQQKATYVRDAYDPVEECRKMLTPKIYAHEEICESDAYKRLWIEAEAALCSMKYQLQVVKASVGLNNNMNPGERDLQGSSVSEDSPVQTMKTSQNSAVFDMIGESQTGTATHETLMNKNVGSGDNLGGSHIRHVTSESNKEDIEASVMARLNVLRSRDNMISNTSTEKQDKLQSLVASEANMSMNWTTSLFSDSQLTTGMESFIEPFESTSAKSSQPSGFTSKVGSSRDKRTLPCSVNANHENQAGEVLQRIFEAQISPEESHLASRTENIIESYIPDNGLWRAQLTREHSIAGSSDWEHVMKEDVTR